MAIYRGQKADATVSMSESATSVTIGALQNIEISVNREVSELYGAGSIKRQDEQASELSIGVTIEAAKWDSSGLENLTNLTASGITDTSDLPKVDVTGTFEDNSGSTLTLTASGVYFEEIPIGGGPDEWITMDLDGTGQDLIKG